MAYTTIKKPSDYFNTKLYTGNGTDNHAITGVGFQPDFIWIKARSAIKEHRLQNAVSGITNHLRSNATNAEAVGSVKTADSDGFTLGTGTSWNENSTTYASWNWLADNTSGSANTDGSISSTVSVNTTSGFSIVSYTGTGSLATVGHGLGVAPAMILTKNRSSAYDWNGLHKSLTGTNGIFLNTTSVSTSSSSFWNNTNPTSSVFSVGSHVTTNESGSNMIAYCFAEKQGFSKFGSYVGNGNADGTFVYTGFKPALFIVKKSSASGTNWKIFDNKRATTFNPTQTPFNANDSSAEDDNSGYALDFLSNGIKLRNTNGNMQNSGDTHIYMAFAEEPLVGDNPATAR